MKIFFTACLLLVAALAHADAVDALREFVRDAKSGRATFTQIVTSPDGAKKKTSSGSFEFARPNRFRFAYARPFEQLIVADGQKVLRAGSTFFSNGRAASVAGRSAPTADTAAARLIASSRACQSA